MKAKDGYWLRLNAGLSCRAYPNVQNLFRELKIEDRLQAS